MSEVERERGLLAQFFFEHSGLKLVALGCAVALFVFVRSQREAERVIAWPLVVDLPTEGSGYALTSVVPASVRVTLRGPRTRLHALNAAVLTPIRVDLSRSERPAVVLLHQNIIPTTAPLEVVSIEPTRLHLTWTQQTGPAGGQAGSTGQGQTMRQRAD